MHEEQILQLVKEDNPANPLSYVHNIVKPLAVNVLNDYILQCDDCNICNCVKTIGYGNPNASILIIGESSLEENQENKDNNPINNSCGETLKLILKKLAINKDSIFFINSVNCFPTRESGQEIIKRVPTVSERKKCNTFLDYAIKIVEPLLIICLGSVATNDINEEIGKQAISEIRGNYFNYRGIKVLPTYNPTYFDYLESLDTMDEEYINSLRYDFFNDLKMGFFDLQKEYPDLDIIKE